MHKANVTRGKHNRFHRTGIKTTNGVIWSFLDHGKGRELLHDFSRLNTTLQVKGEMIDGSRTINVVEFQKI